MINWKYAASVMVVTIVIMAIGTVLWNSDTTEIKPGTTVEVELNSTSAKQVSWQRGREDAPITIDEYPDLGCHICIEKEIMVLQALNTYPGKIRVIHHHYPSPGFYEKLAEALEAAGEQGKFWEFHDRLVQNMPEDMTALSGLVADLGLDMERFNEALNSGTFSEIVKSAKEEAVTQGIEHVTMLINGKEYKKSPGTLDDLYDAIDRELKELSTNDAS